MIFKSAIVLFIGIIIGTMAVRGNVPIIVETGAGKRAVMKLCSDASDQLRKGDVAGAKRKVDAALRIDPKLWPALYIRAQIFRKQGKYELAIQDCNEALRQYPDEDMIDTLAAAYAETGDLIRQCGMQRKR